MFRLFVIIVILASGNSYKIPEPSIERLDSGGIRVSISDVPGVQFFAFHANVNIPIATNESGAITGEVIRSRNNRWIFEDKNIELRDNDLLHYWIYVQANDSSYTRNGDERRTTTETRQGEMSDCVQSVTAVRGKMAPCRDRLVFEENFDRGNSSWTREILLPLDPDYEFCAYRELPNSLKFENGTMGIVPLILDDLYGENATLFGKLDLASSCTSSVPLECNRRAIGHSILPPVISARLKTINSFYFRYGKIDVRAKFPKGDWLYPELWLEPKQRTYGPGYSGGRVLLGMARGNENLLNNTSSDETQFGSKILEFGLRTGRNENVREHKVRKKESLGTWNDDFHVYTSIWKPEGFRFQVDGNDVGRIESGEWSSSDESEEKSEKKNHGMAPYDNEFYITVGLGVGGIRVFPDGTSSGRTRKPWRNVEAKAMLHFWRGKEQWLPSWKGANDFEDAQLRLDYIKVWTV